ncbi:MAG: hypothetical protein U5K29_06535 [Acidimicrobiales bacterium]|nr:hypothetical protein [Acidimicrobiales bacterium]
MRRVSVVGTSGSGKSRLARRIAAAIGAPWIELDAAHHQRGWEPIDPERFLVEVDRATSGDRWVVDGNYRAVVCEGPVWERADTVVWLDLPRRTVMRQIVVRTVRRTVTREELWNGNREPLSNLWRWDPERSVIRWAWTRHHALRRRYLEAMADERWAHLDFVRVRSHVEADRWVQHLGDASQR